MEWVPSEYIKVHIQRLNVHSFSMVFFFGFIDDKSVLSEPRDIKQLAEDKNSPFTRVRTYPVGSCRRHQGEKKAFTGQGCEKQYRRLHIRVKQQFSCRKRTPLFFSRTARPSSNWCIAQPVRGGSAYAYISIGRSPLSAACATDLNPPLPWDRVRLLSA